MAQVLNRHIERLEEMLQDALEKVSERDELQTQRDVARTERDIATAQVEALRATLAAADQDRDPAGMNAATTRHSEPPRHSWWPFRRAS